MYPAAARSLTIPNALRSVMPTVSAMSRSLEPGSREMHSSTRAWLVRKPQVGTRKNYHILFPEQDCRFSGLDTRPGLPERVRLELGHPGERRRDPHLARREVDDHGDIVLDQDHPAEAVLVVGHQVIYFEHLDRRILGRRLEGTGRQVTPVPGVGTVHSHQSVPFRGRMPARP